MAPFKELNVTLCLSDLRKKQLCSAQTQLRQSHLRLLAALSSSSGPPPHRVCAGDSPPSTNSKSGETNRTQCKRHRGVSSAGLDCNIRGMKTKQNKCKEDYSWRLAAVLTAGAVCGKAVAPQRHTASQRAQCSPPRSGYLNSAEFPSASSNTEHDEPGRRTIQRSS